MMKNTTSEIHMLTTGLATRRSARLSPPMSPIQ